MAAAGSGLLTRAFPGCLQVLKADSDRRTASCGQTLLLKLLGSKIVASRAAPVGVLLTHETASVVYRTSQVPAE